MKSLMAVVAAAMAVVSFAQEAKVAQDGARPERRSIRPAHPRAERGMFGGGVMPDPVMRVLSNPQMLEKLGLTEEQKAKLKAAVSARGADRDLQKKIRQGTEKQMQLMSAETIDEAAVMAVIDEVFEARKAAAKEQAKRLIAARAVLTPEQLSLLKAEMASMAPKRQRPAKGAKPAAEAK